MSCEARSYFRLSIVKKKKKKKLIFITMVVERLSYLSNLATENYLIKSFIKRKSMSIYIGN